ncbi:MAG: hypothetical protein ABI787_09005 [Spartobacteria bacterium]
MTFPTAVGFGTNGFYGQGFGFFSTEVSVSVPLAFIPEAYGSWSSSLTGQYFRLGTNSARFTDNPRVSGAGSERHCVGAKKHLPGELGCATYMPARRSEIPA